MESLGKLFETDKLVSLAINIIINCIFFYLNKRKIDVLEEQNLILMERVNNLEKNLSNFINFINGGNQPQISPANQSPIKPPPSTQSITNRKIQLPVNSIPIQPPKVATSGLRKSLIIEPSEGSDLDGNKDATNDLDQILEEEEEKERLLNVDLEVNPPEIGDPDDNNLIISNTQTGLINPEKKKSYAGMEIDE